MPQDVQNFHLASYLAIIRGIEIRKFVLLSVDIFALEGDVYCPRHGLNLATRCVGKTACTPVCIHAAIVENSNSEMIEFGAKLKIKELRL